jgi:hypothetical protein
MVADADFTDRLSDGLGFQTIFLGFFRKDYVISGFSFFRTYRVITEWLRGCISRPSVKTCLEILI